MAHLIHVGNSFGVRIPKAIIIQLGFEKNSDLVFKVTDEGLLISPKRKSREGWAKAFEQNKEVKEELLLGEAMNNEFDKGEWKW